MSEETLEQLLEGKKWIEAIPMRKRIGLAIALREAFEDGYNSYQTQCGAFNSLEEAWEDYGPKHLYARLMGEGDNDDQ